MKNEYPESTIDEIENFIIFYKSFSFLIILVIIGNGNGLWFIFRCQCTFRRGHTRCKTGFRCKAGGCKTLLSQKYYLLLFFFKKKGEGGENVWEEAVIIPGGT